MTHYLLDTNVLSETVRPRPDHRVALWMSEQADCNLFVASMTLGEIRRGILQTARGRRRNELEAWFSGPSGLPALFSGRVLPFDSAAALAWARMMADGARRGRPRSALDMIIAATAEVSSCVVATANTKDFEGVETFNPFA